MPRYFFDIRDGESLVRDEQGAELADPDAARLQATIALTEMARDELPHDGAHRDFAVTVRQQARELFTVTLDFALETPRVDRDGKDSR